jgi:SAM-dependent methyltransferase
MDDREIARLYDSVSEEYNQTPLATKDGWISSQSEYGLLQMRALAAHVPSNGLLVDIGTGMGIGPRFARKLGARVISLDSYDASGSAAIENVKLAGVEGLYCDILREPFPVESASADCVLFADVIEHLLHSPKPTLQEIFRVLKPGGVCIASTPNAVRLTVRMKTLLGYSNWPRLQDYFHLPYHGGHHHEYMISEFRFAFEEVGFRVDSVDLHEDSLRITKIGGLGDIATQSRSKRHTVEPLHFRMVKAPLIALTGLFPSLRSTMILTARKPA